MRAFVAIPIVLLGFGCRGSCKLPLPCRDAPLPHAPCDAVAPGCEVEAPGRQVVKAPAVKVEVKPAEEIHVKAPPQKVVINAPPTPGAATAPAAVQQFAPAAVQTAMPQFAPVMVQAAAPQANVIASTVQSVTPSRARLALGLDVIRIPVPFPRIFAVPGPQEVTTQTTYETLPQAQFSVPVAVAAPQAVYAAPAAAQAVYAPPAAAPLAVQPQAQTCPPGTVPMCVPIQPATGQSQMTREQTLKEIEELMKRIQSINTQMSAPCDKK